MSKYIHRAKTLPAIPMDYYTRWDASRLDECPVTYLTDEATNDVDSWLDETGKQTFTDVSVVTTYPSVSTDPDGFPCIHFAGDGGLRVLDSSLNSVDQTVFLAYRTDFASGSYLYAGTTHCGVYFTNRFSVSPTAVNYYIASGNTDGYSTNNFNDRRVIGVAGNTHNGTNDNDVTAWVGKTQVNQVLTASDADTAKSYLSLGSTATGAQEGQDVDVFEMIVYDRALSTGEREAVVDYLSNKWSITSADNASDTIETASTAATWTSSNIDKAGEGTTNHPGSQPGEYSIVRVGDRGAIHLGNYIQDTFGSSIKYWFDSSVTSGMTFATGSASAGGTVSSWVDRTGAVTMDTTTSGDSAVDFTPKYKGKGTIQGGSSGTPKSLESTANVTYTTTVGNQRLFWAVVDYETVSVDGCIVDFFGNLLTVDVDAAFLSDVYTGVNHPVSVVSGASTYSGLDYQPLSVKDATDGPHIIVVRVTIESAAPHTVETWYGGLKAPDRGATASMAAGVAKVGVGARTISVFDNDGRLFECGAVDGAGTAITDAQVYNTIRYLCEKYDVDYMPDTTPLDIGLHARSTSTVAQTDCCKWYRSDKGLSETAWALHPKCAALHTTPAGFAMVATSTNAGVAVESGRTNSTSSATTDILLSGGYDYTETTDFPAMGGGATFGAVAYADSTLTTSGRCWSLGGVTAMMQWNSGGTSPAAVYVGNRSYPGNGDTDAWNFFVGRQAFDDDGTGSTDGDPHTWWTKNDDSGDDDLSTVTTYGTVKTVAHGETTGGAGAANAKVRELWSWKHVLSDTEVENLRRYVAWRYPDMRTLVGL